MESGSVSLWSSNGMRVWEEAGLLFVLSSALLCGTPGFISKMSEWDDIMAQLDIASGTAVRELSV